MPLGVRLMDTPGLPTEVHAQGGTGTTLQARQAGGGRQAPHPPGASRGKPTKEDLAAGDTLE